MFMVNSSQMPQMLTAGCIKGLAPHVCGCHAAWKPGDSRPLTPLLCLQVLWLGVTSTSTTTTTGRHLVRQKALKGLLCIYPVLQHPCLLLLIITTLLLLPIISIRTRCAFSAGSLGWMATKPSPFMQDATLL
jgi:hypothetical protein